MKSQLASQLWCLDTFSYLQSDTASAADLESDDRSQQLPETTASKSLTSWRLQRHAAAATEHSLGGC